MSADSPQNTAAWLKGKGIPLEVKQAPYTKPAADQIVIRNHAIGLNIIEAIKQDIGDYIQGWIKYPFIIGTDVAGEVIEVGSAVTRFKPGDRVVGFAVSTDKHSNTSSEGAYQLYPILREHLTAQIPTNTTFESAATIPLAMATAASGLFGKDELALPYPTIPPAQPRNEIVLVWGASTAVGCNAVQLACAAGYEVYATAGLRNHNLVRSLGASRVFDYKSPTVVADLVAALKSSSSSGKSVKCAGAIAMGNHSTENCVEILSKLPNANKFVAQATMTSAEGGAQGFGALVYMLRKMGSLWLKGKTKGVGYKFIWGTDPGFNDVGPNIFQEWLPGALADGSYKSAPEAEVVGHGLDKIQGAFELLKKGVSAKKLVVTV